MNIVFGDIITYVEDDYFVTHRIVEKNSNKLITQGDSNNEKDGEIDENKIIGKVVFNSLVIGNFIIIYLKYVLILFTLIIIIFNMFISIRGRKIDGKKQSKVS